MTGDPLGFRRKAIKLAEALERERFEHAVTLTAFELSQQGLCGLAFDYGTLLGIYEGALIVRHAPEVPA